MQERRNSSALAIELPLSCTSPSTCLDTCPPKILTLSPTKSCGFPSQRLSNVEALCYCVLLLILHHPLVVTCQNFQFLQVCSSDGLFVCLSVCNVDDTGRTVKSINTKFYTYMYLGSGYMCILFGVDDVIDDVIRSKNRSNFEIAITPSIFELERRTKS